MDLAKEKKAIANNIRKFGWHCLHVFAKEEGGSPFTYTIGLTESYGVPEIMVFGLPAERGHGVLSACAHLIKEGHRFETDMPDDNVLQGDYKVIFKMAKPQSFEYYFGTAMRYYGDKPFEAMVMFIPDKKHHFPWKINYAGAPAEEALSIVMM
jgi:Domain of unknown function (DUF4262)